MKTAWLLRPAGALAAAALLGALAFAAFRVVPPLAAADLRVRDLYHAMFYPAQPPRDDIAIVLIDETTIAGFAYRSPIDRGFLAELIASLRAHGPRAIAVDLLIDQPTEDAKDAAFLDAVKATEGAPVVLAAADEADGLLPAQAETLAAATAGARVGQAALLRDPYDFVTRAAPPTREMAGRPTPSMAVAMARAGGLAAPGEGFDIAFTPSPPGEDFAPLLIAGFHGFFAPETVRDRFIFIGVGLDGVDRHRTPLQALSDEADRPGVESHAQALAQIIDGRRLTVSPGWAELALAIVAAVLTVGALFLPAGFAVRIGAAFAVVALLAAAPAAAVASGGLLLPAAAPLTAALAAGGGLTAARWRAEQLTRRRLRSAFGRYVSPAVVRQIEAAPEALALGGERREITCVFTDVAGFTTLCESLPGDELASLLNGYLGGASQIFVDHGGTIDKFVGDAIVGFFGAPVARSDHAAAAIRMAVALDAYAERYAREVRKTGRPFGVTRLGVHSGEATVGNFGGDVFFDYTAMGDTVNVAARLEGANKAYGGRLTISEDALAAAGGAVDGVLTRPVGRLRVKGREAPLGAHEAFASDDPRAASRSAYLAAYALLEDGRCAADAFAALAEEFSDDPLFAFHAARAADGETGAVITLKEK